MGKMKVTHPIPADDRLALSCHCVLSLRPSSSLPLAPLFLPSSLVVPEHT